MQIHHDHGLITVAGVLLVVLVCHLRAVAHAREALYSIPQTRVPSGDVVAILPFSRERRDSVAIIHDDHPPSVLVFRQGSWSKLSAAPSLPIAGGIMDCVMALDGSTFFILTQDLTLLAVSAQSLSLEWTADVVFGARTRPDLETASIFPLNDTITLLIMGTHLNGSVISALVDTSPGARPASVTPRFCGAHETDLGIGLTAFESFFDSDTGGSESNASSVLITFSSHSAIVGGRLTSNSPHAQKQADVSFVHGTRFTAAVVQSLFSSVPEPLCLRKASSRSFASIEQLRNISGQEGRVGLESLSLYLPCQDCRAEISRTGVVSGSRRSAKSTKARVTFANGMQPPLHLCHVHGIYDCMASADPSGTVVVGGCGRSGPTGLVSSLDIERVEARPRWQVLLSERPLLLHYSAIHLRIVVITRRNVVILGALDGSVAARIPLEVRDENGQVARQRKGFGSSQAGLPTGLVAERDGVVWVAMNGAKLAVLGVDLQQIDLKSWPSEVFSLSLVVAVSCSLSIFLLNTEGECGFLMRRDLEIRTQRRDNSDAKAGSRAPGPTSNACPKMEALRGELSEESRAVFGAEDL